MNGYHLNTNHDKSIIDLFILKDRIRLSNYNRLIKSKRYDNIREYLMCRFKDFTTIKESIYRIYYHIECIPKCPICGKQTKFNIGYSEHSCYTTYCSIHCANSDPNVYKKQNDTKTKKYGNCINLQKRKETNLKKYGVEESAQSKEILSKQIKTKIERYRSSNNSYKRWNTIKSDEERYSKMHDKLVEFFNSDEFKEKQYITKKKNNSFNISKSEEDSYALLKERYPDVLRQYKSDKYPFSCDFYIPTKDLYIECNYHWTHGGHLYGTNKIDEEIAQLWKSKNSKYYDRAYDTWTRLDVLKFDIAKRNKLNYLVFYTFSEFQQWIDTVS